VDKLKLKPQHVALAESQKTKGQWMYSSKKGEKTLPKKVRSFSRTNGRKTAKHQGGSKKVGV